MRAGANLVIDNNTGSQQKSDFFLGSFWGIKRPYIDKNAFRIKFYSSNICLDLLYLLTKWANVIRAFLRHTVCGECTSSLVLSERKITNFWECQWQFGGIYSHLNTKTEITDLSYCWSPSKSHRNLATNDPNLNFNWKMWVSWIKSGIRSRTGDEGTILK